MEEIKKELLLNDKKPSKHIILKVLIIAVAILGLSLISLTFIPVKYSVDLHTNSVSKITLYQSGNASSVIYKDFNNDDFNKILNTFKSSFSVDKFANVFFAGKLDNKEKIAYDYQSNAITNIAKLSKENTKYILLQYDDEQQIMLNGKEYTTSELNSASKTYTKVLIEINNASTLTQSTIYYINASDNTSFRVTFNTTGEKLYNLIDNYFN